MESQVSLTLGRLSWVQTFSTPEGISDEYEARPRIDRVEQAPRATRLRLAAGFPCGISRRAHLATTLGRHSPRCSCGGLCRIGTAFVAIVVPPDVEFPGGSVRKGETPEEAARRELQEEIELVPVGPLQAVGQEAGQWEGFRDQVYFFELHMDRLPALHLDNREITSAKLVSPNLIKQSEVTGPVAVYLRHQYQLGRCTYPITDRRPTRLSRPQSSYYLARRASLDEQLPEQLPRGIRIDENDRCRGSNHPIKLSDFCRRTP